MTVMIEEDDGTVEKPVGIGTGTGMLPVEETVTVLTPEADDEPEAAALTVEVTVVSLEADDDPEAGTLEVIDDCGVVELETVPATVDVTVLTANPDIALYALESPLVTEVVTVEMAVGMGIGTGTMTGPDAPEVLMLDAADEPEAVTDDAAMPRLDLFGELRSDCLPEAEAAENTLFTTAAAFDKALDID